MLVDAGAIWQHAIRRHEDTRGYLAPARKNGATRTGQLARWAHKKITAFVAERGDWMCMSLGRDVQSAANGNRTAAAQVSARTESVGTPRKYSI